MDGAHLNMKGKHYYDFPLHFKGPCVDQQYQIRDITRLLVEVADQPNATNIKKCLNDAFTLKYQVSMQYFSRGFSVVTDGSAVMESVSNASISSGIHAPSETWSNCMSHVLSNVIKSVLAS